jgi:hypothetical protein
VRYSGSEDDAMPLHTALAICALIASCGLLIGNPNRWLPGIMLVASAFEVLAAFHIVRIAVFAQFLSGLAMGAVILLASLVLLFKSSGKLAIGSATVAAFIGLIQVAQALQWIR